MRRSDAAWFLTRVKRTIYSQKMITAGDRVAVGLSGGKDSAALLYILDLFQRQAPFNFQLVPVYIDLGWPADSNPLQLLAERFALTLAEEKTVISRVVFERRQEKNPCALCAKMRRGALHRAALMRGCNKVALGHHLDDAIQTFMLNLIFTGKMDTFKPLTYLDRAGLYLLRPLIQLPEKTLSSLVKREALPLMKNPCPVSGKTRRNEMAGLFEDIVDRYPDLRDKCRTALLNGPLWPGPDNPRGGAVL